LSLHSTRRGGRSGQDRGLPDSPEIIGTVILKGRQHLWGQANRHYHHGMQAGDNTLNAHCARVLLRSIIANNGCYSRDHFLQSYIEFMTADPPRHRDTYAKSYHRGFFANLVVGKPPHQCGARTHDTPSMGGLVTIGPLAINDLLRGTAMTTVQATCREHLFLTHPDEALGRICDGYVALIAGLLLRKADEPPDRHLLAAAQTTMGIDLARLVDAPSQTGESSVAGIPPHAISVIPGPAFCTWCANTGKTPKRPCWSTPTWVAKTRIAARYSGALSVNHATVRSMNGLGNSWTIGPFKWK
jgi:hypothetical protein